jgi:hypothetical protein
MAASSSCRPPLAEQSVNVSAAIAPSKKRRYEDIEGTPPSAQLPPSSSTPASPPPSPYSISEAMLENWFARLLANTDPVLVGILGGSGTELKMPLQTADRRMLTWKKFATEVRRFHPQRSIDSCFHNNQLTIQGNCYPLANPH